MIDKEYNDLIVIEKILVSLRGRGKKRFIQKRLQDVKQLLDFKRSQSEPYLEEIKIINLNISKNLDSRMGKKYFF